MMLKPMQHQTSPFGYRRARLLKIVTRVESVLFGFVPLVELLVVKLLALDREGSGTTVMAACLPQTVVPFPFTAKAFCAPAIVHALANSTAVAIRNFLDINLLENIFVARIFGTEIACRSSLQ